MSASAQRAKRARLSIDSQAANDEAANEIAMGEMDDPTPRPNRTTFAIDINELTAALPVNTHYGPSAAAGQNPRALELADAVNKLPKRLQRPARTTVTPEGLAAVNPALAAVPLETVMSVVRDKGPGYWKTLSTARIESLHLTPGERIARTVEVTLAGVQDPATAPSHVMAVVDAPAVLQRQLGLAKPTIRLLPVYHLVLAAQCASLPAFPPALEGNSRVDRSGLRIVLPVFQLTVPHYESFPWLLNFLYNGKTGHIRRHILPIANDVVAGIVKPLPVHIAFQTIAPQAQATGPAHLKFVLPNLARAAADAGMDELLRSVKLLHGLWSNATALGVNDPTLWKMLDTCWDILLGGVSMRLARDAGAAPKPPPPRPIKGKRRSMGTRASSSASRVASTAVNSTAPSRVTSAAVPPPAPVAGPSSAVGPMSSAPTTINPALTLNNPSPVTLPIAPLPEIPMNLPSTAPMVASTPPDMYPPSTVPMVASTPPSMYPLDALQPLQLPPASMPSHAYTTFPTPPTMYTSATLSYQPSSSRSTLDRSSSLTPSPPRRTSFNLPC
ncbi:hypothetical protein AURDEDRAFT_169021 [Auricularia subglabra TFB-10046 SS5]|nr:hypothetical protein AURDEDRAFT_169021 [Auricularia subglabra TFB-10046 SS5]